MTQTAYAIQTIQETFTLCQKCPKKLVCIELCSEAEEYANQDYVALKELPVADLEYIKEEFPEVVKTVYLTKLEKKVVMLLNKDFPRSEISYLLNITSNYLRVSIHRITTKFNNS